VRHGRRQRHQHQHPEKDKIKTRYLRKRDVDLLRRVWEKAPGKCFEECMKLNHGAFRGILQEIEPRRVQRHLRN
jgi:hypothetical protein